MLTTASDTLNILIKIEVYSLIISVIFGIVIAVSYPIFNKLNRNAGGALIPVYNLFEFCNLNDFRETVGLIYLIPGFNIILIMLMSYRLKDKFKTSDGFNRGLLFLPFVFVPMLAYSDIDAVDEYDHDKGKKPKEEEEKIEEAEVEDINVDSIFKTEAQMMEEVKPYKAKKVQVNEEFINSKPAEKEKIEKVSKK